MSKFGDFITSPYFMDLAQKGVEKAIAELRAKGIEPACSPLPPASPENDQQPPAGRE